MKRFVNQRLMEWKKSGHRKPLILRGARQVGKTHAVRTLGKSFEGFIEINFEYEQEYTKIFEKNLDPERILREISLLRKATIKPGKTLLFFDEIQACPKAIIGLRYFYEKMPDLHVIAAGSLLEFAHELVGIPVGRVQSLYVHPMTYLEFLIADGHTSLAQEILQGNPLADVIHHQALRYLGEYLALGGMPEVIQRWIEEKDPLKCTEIQSTLLETYQQDFQKYAKKSQLKYLSLLFETIPRQLGEKFKYSKVGEYRKRELEPSLDLLLTASIFHKVIHTSAQGVPIGAEASPEKFKLLFIDVGLTQALLGLDLAAWFIEPEVELINKGKLVEAFVGQELLAYFETYTKKGLYYWQRDTRGSSAEVDYVIQKGNHILPLEVKSGKTMKLKSLHAFLKTHASSIKGLKVSIDPCYQSKQIDSIPLYAIGAYVAKDLGDFFND
ncbi:MAG: ATP-binding protein [Chlamydiales bacterium]|nr:ATP-binding protein [Chlamydiales bacterium]